LEEIKHRFGNSPKNLYVLIGLTNWNAAIMLSSLIFIGNLTLFEIISNDDL
jgi:hypothetical protein